MIVLETTIEKGKRLEDITESVLEQMKKLGIIKNYQRLPNEDRPDFIVDEDIGIEDKNWDPNKKNDMNEHKAKTKILCKFKGHDWKKKVLIIPKLRFYKRDEEICRRLLGDFIIIEIDSFVTKDNMIEMTGKLFNELMRIFEEYRKKSEDTS